MSPIGRVEAVTHYSRTLPSNRVPRSSTQSQQLVTKPAGGPPQATPSSSRVGMVLFELESGISRAEALLQSVSTKMTTASSRLAVARAYSLEMQAHQEIKQLRTEGAAATREWYA